MSLNIIQSAENFDSKYCNAAEKLGNNTLERYQTYLKDEKNKHEFKEYYYYFNEFDPNDKANTKGEKFFNPHLNISANTNKQMNFPLEKEASPQKVNSFETKFSRIKLMSASGSTNTVLRQYRQSSGSMNSSNSTNSNSSMNNKENNTVIRKSGSVNELNY